jgi:hypothetical protein
MKWKVVLLILFISLFVSSVHAQNYGSWSLTDSLKEIRYFGASVDLLDGNILVSGGSSVKSLRSAEIYDYKKGQWRTTGSMNVARNSHLLIRLNNGNILTVGGIKKTCELFDPIAEKWSFTDSINYPIDDGHTVSLLNDGNVLLVGGYYYLANGKSVSPQIAEIYNVKTGKWTSTDSLQIDVAEHSATKLQDGRVLVVGGFSITKKNEVNNCELFDPVIGKWSVAAPLNIARYRHTATLLNDGRVLVCGGNNQSTNFPRSCELYDPVTNKWVIVTPTFYFRESHTAISLDNGLLFLGGAGVKTWEIYDVINFKQLYHGDYPGNSSNVPGTIINKLPNGEIIVAGGATKEYGSWVITKECNLFDPLKTGIKEDQELPNKCCLYQNYPNPFNPETNISFSIPQRSNVKLVVYDVLGKEVATLANSVYEAGKYNIQFNGGNLASGMYFYTLTTAQGTISKKMLLVK